jgi:3-hydroxyacyl-[acyl-carrier-protein] dehydratase
MNDSHPQTLGGIDLQQIMQLLPHRYPFLLVDKIINIVGDETATGIKNVTMNEPHFTGHFPGNPVMPGVLMIEGMAQTAGAVVASAHYNGKKNLVYFMTIDNAKFRKPVVPGDVLEYRIEKLKQRRDIFKYRCEAFVGDAKVAEAEVGAMMFSERDN